jgi:hypothetical protein
MFDDDDLEMSEVEEWYDNNLRYFHREPDQPFGPSLEIQLFYSSVYLPFKQDLRKPLREMIDRHYLFIATECRPEMLARIDREVDWMGHEFILFLHEMVLFCKTGRDLREIYPKLDQWTISYPSYRKPRYMRPSSIAKLAWMTDEQKQILIDEDKIEADLAFAFKDKPRSEFFNLLQTMVFKYYKELQDLDKDGWTMFEVFLHDEYTKYEIDFEHYDGFIEYGFGIEDLNIPYKEYTEKFSAKWKERRDEEIRRKLEEDNKKLENEL